MKNKGGRPPLEEGKRSFKIDVRLTEAEYRQVEALEKASGLNKAELIRKRLFVDGQGTLLNAGALLRSLDQISLELSRNGNNINQLARYVNRLQKHGVLSPKIFSEFQELMSRHHRRQSELVTLFRKLLRIAKG